MVEAAIPYLNSRNSANQKVPRHFELRPKFQFSLSGSVYLLNTHYDLFIRSTSVSKGQPYDFISIPVFTPT